MKLQIDSLDVQEHMQIYSIMKKHTDVFTKTLNGVFVSSENLSDECLKQIENHIQFCNDQHKRMEEDQKQRKTYERLIE
jgi:hypothetical protein